MVLTPHDCDVRTRTTRIMTAVVKRMYFNAHVFAEIVVSKLFARKGYKTNEPLLFRLYAGFKNLVVQGNIERAAPHLGTAKYDIEGLFVIKLES